MLNTYFLFNSCHSNPIFKQSNVLLNTDNRFAVGVQKQLIECVSSLLDFNIEQVLDWHSNQTLHSLNIWYYIQRDNCIIVWKIHMKAKYWNQSMKHIKSYCSILKLKSRDVKTNSFNMAMALFPELYLIIKNYWNFIHSNFYEFSDW